MEQKMSEPIIDGLLRRTEVMNIIGPAKCGMSMLALNLAFAAAYGDDFVGFKAAKSKVLFVDTEMREETIRARMDELAKHYDGIPVGLQLLSRRGSSMEELMSSLPAHSMDADLVIVDTMEATPSADSAIKEFAALDATARRAKAAVVSIRRSLQPFFVKTAGVGASRLYDSYLALAAHVTRHNFTMEMAARSFPPQDSRTISFKYPEWRSGLAEVEKSNDD